MQRHVPVQRRDRHAGHRSRDQPDVSRVAGGQGSPGPTCSSSTRSTWQPAARWEVDPWSSTPRSTVRARAAPAASCRWMVGGSSTEPGSPCTTGVLYVGLTSHCDEFFFHGWLFAYDPATLAQKSVFNTSPNNQGAAIWQSGNGIAANDKGLFYCTGNGDSCRRRLGARDQRRPHEPRQHAGGLLHAEQRSMCSTARTRISPRG